MKLKDNIMRITVGKLRKLIQEAVASSVDDEIERIVSMMPAKYDIEVTSGDTPKLNVKVRPNAPQPRAVFTKKIQEILKDGMYTFSPTFSMGGRGDFWIRDDQTFGAISRITDDGQELRAEISFLILAPSASVVQAPSPEKQMHALDAPGAGDRLYKFFKGASPPEHFGQFWPDSGMDESKKRD